MCVCVCVCVCRRYINTSSVNDNDSSDNEKKTHLLFDVSFYKAEKEAGIQHFVNDLDLGTCFCDVYIIIQAIM
jgi:hypothetical protein